MATETEEQTYEESLTKILLYLKNSYEKDILNGIGNLLEKKEITTEKFLMEKMRVNFINLYIDRILSLISNQNDVGPYEIPCMECMCQIRLKSIQKQNKEKIEAYDEEETYDE